MSVCPDLADLDARLVAWNGHGRMRDGVRDVASADGVVFLCPACYVAHGGAEGTHSVLIWFSGRRAPPDSRPDPRWKATGTRIHELTLDPSINLGCWHGWIRNGRTSTC